MSRELRIYQFIDNIKINIIVGHLKKFLSLKYGKLQIIRAFCFYGAGITTKKKQELCSKNGVIKELKI